MRNQLQQGYYALMSTPGLGRLAAWCAPTVKRVVDKLARHDRRGLHTRVENLETQLFSARAELNAFLALSREYAKFCPSFSIVISTCDRRELLQEALESAARQRYPEFEIVCVNGPSADGTDSLLDAWRDRIKVCACPERNLSMSRNIGIAAAGGEIIAFMDDDATAPQDWLMELARGYSDASVAAVGGCVRDHTGTAWQSRVCVADRYGDVRYYPGVAEAVKAEGTPETWGTRKYFSPVGTNVSFRRAALVEIGGFDENYAYHLDETDVLLRLTDAGKKIKFCEPAEVTHAFAGSNLRRSDRTPVSLYHQARSKTYFILRHAAPVFGREAAERRIAAYLAWLASTVQAAFRRGRLDKSNLERLKEELEQGRKAGEELAAKGARSAGLTETASFRNGASFAAAASAAAPGAHSGRASATPATGRQA